MTLYTDTCLKNSLPSTTDWLSKWIDAFKKLIYPNGWPKKRPPWSKKFSPKGTIPNNYRPITCLPMMWNILTAQIRKGIYDSLISRGLFHEAQKRRHKATRGTEELLCIDQHILKESKARQKTSSYSVDWLKKKAMICTRYTTKL